MAIVVCDATDGVTSQDFRVAELAMGANCATVLVLNKWDITEMDEDDLIHERAKVNQKLRQRPKVLTASAKTGRSLERVLREALALADRATNRVPTPELNRWLSETLQVRQPPMKQGHRLKLIYAAQIGERPPRFAIQVNNRARVTREYAYFLENRLRARFGLDGVPRDHRLQRAQAAAQRALAAPAQVRGRVHGLPARRLDLEQLQAVPGERPLADAGAQDAEPRAVVELDAGADVGVQRADDALVDDPAAPPGPACGPRR